MSRERMLDARTLARIRDLKLLARLVVDGSLHGIHRSRQLGEGMEFSQYRQYEPGDDPRQIDWKLYARSDRVFVRQSERESHVAVWFLVDASASMAQTGADIEHWSRLDCARALVASLAYLCQRQGDAFGLIGLSDRDLTYVPCRNDDRQLDRLLLALQRLQPRGAWPLDAQLNVLWDQLQAPGLVVLVSDFFQQQTEIERLVGKLGAGGNEVLTLQLLTEEEISFPYRGNIAFVDRESGETVHVDAESVRERYLQQFESAAAQLRATLAGLGIAHRRHQIEAPLHESVWHFLEARERGDGQRRREAG